jgi:hypothetical protein
MFIHRLLNLLRDNMHSALPATGICACVLVDFKFASTFCWGVPTFCKHLNGQEEFPVLIQVYNYNSRSSCFNLTKFLCTVSFSLLLRASCFVASWWWWQWRKGDDLSDDATACQMTQLLWTKVLRAHMLVLCITSTSNGTLLQLAYHWTTLILINWECLQHFRDHPKPLLKEPTLTTDYIKLHITSTLHNREFITHHGIAEEEQRTNCYCYRHHVTYLCIQRHPQPLQRHLHEHELQCNILVRQGGGHELLYCT